MIIQVVRKPQLSDKCKIFSRPTRDNSELFASVKNILENVKLDGDAAIRKYERNFDNVTLDKLSVTDDEFREAELCVDADLEKALRIAHSNIKKFHESQFVEGEVVETQPGVKCWQKSVPIERVGLYVPGGTAPLFSTVLMLATPAKIAGCSEIVLCTPPDKNGKINPAILVASKIAGVSKVFKIGGVQAIGAMAYGTESVPKVSKIFGPGNQYVTEAKMQVTLNGVAIDMPAGPSEVAIIVDKTSNPVFVAADILSQAEHGVDSQAIVFSTCECLIDKIVAELNKQLSELPRKEFAKSSLQHSRIILFKNGEELMEAVNEYAPEHLIISVDDHAFYAERVKNAGSVFLGHYSCESAGDYASGTNHTLPTNGYAKAYSGVNLSSFMRKITFQELTAEGVKSIGRIVEIMAENEHLTAHKNAMSVRLNSINQ